MKPDMLISHRCLPADALWNLAMAVNVYLTIFHKYSASRLKRLEWIYLLMCYGVTFIVALVCLFISTPSRGKIYGPNVLWCSIDIKWVYLRIALVYGPAWVCITASLCIYVLAGIEIFRKRAQLVRFNSAPSKSPHTGTGFVENAGTDLKTTQIHISSEPAAFSPPFEENCGTVFLAQKEWTTVPMPAASQSNRPSVVTTIRSMPSRSTSENTVTILSQTPQAIQQRRQSRAAMEFNTAALGYTKVALLFFCSLLITWVPPSVNRFNSFLHPHRIHVPSSYATSIVLPLMGFWNSVIYIVTSWRAVQDLLSGKLGRPRLRRGQSINLSRPCMHSSKSRDGSESESIERLATANHEGGERAAR